MATPDLDTQVPQGPVTAVRPLAGVLRLCLPGILVFSCATLVATNSYAQDPDVAEAARQERARKEAQQKKPKHVYTAEDLKREHILTKEDQAQLEAKKNQPAPTAAPKPGEAVDGSAVAKQDDLQPLPADAPLGDVARRYRREKESQQLQRSAEFHLPFADAPVLASPKPPVQPLGAPPVLPAPRIVPNLPHMKRSPFERPALLPPAPRQFSFLPPTVRVAPSQPIAPATPSARVKLNVVIVKPGDSLWKLAQKNLGKGLLWRDLLSYNPGLRDPNVIAIGSEIFVPATISSQRTSTKFTVRKGDTLSAIALAQLGHASAWSCIANANPEIHNANLIHEGQVLLLPANCKP